jgi:hypothetical protein
MEIIGFYLGLAILMSVISWTSSSGCLKGMKETFLDRKIEKSLELNSKELFDGKS